MDRRRPRASAAIVAAAGLALAACGGQSPGPPGGGGPPLAVALAGSASLRAGAAPGATQQRPTSRAATRRTTHPARRTPAVAGGAEGPATPPSPRRTRASAPPRTIALAGADRLALPACKTLRDARAGRFPDPVVARGAERALAFVTESAAAALLGLPVDVPSAGVAERERLDAALARLSRSLAAGDDGGASATAVAAHIRAYAAALGIGGCG